MGPLKVIFPPEVLILKWGWEGTLVEANIIYFWDKLNLADKFLSKMIRAPLCSVRTKQPPPRNIIPILLEENSTKFNQDWLKSTSTKVTSKQINEENYIYIFL